MELAFTCNDIDYSQINRIEPGKVNFSISFLYQTFRRLKIQPHSKIIFRLASEESIHFPAGVKAEEITK